MLDRVILHYLKQGKGINRLKGLFRLAKNIKSIEEFSREAKKFALLGGKVDEISPYLKEKTESAGVNFGQYFWQDLVVAQEVNRLSPKNHLDVGSRIDGFIAHVATTRPITFLDIRPLQSLVPNVTFLQGDILTFRSEIRYELVTSLHVLEHIGLGRYGDEINPNGHLQAFERLVNCADIAGRIWVSFQVAERTITQFNGQRIIGFLEPLHWAQTLNLKLEKFVYLGNDEILKEFDGDSLPMLRPTTGSLGIYFFRRNP